MVLSGAELPAGNAARGMSIWMRLLRDDAPAVHPHSNGQGGMGVVDGGNEEVSGLVSRPGPSTRRRRMGCAPVGDVSRRKR